MRFVHETPAAFSLSTAAVHPQLRDLLVAPPDSVATLYENEITRHSFDSPPSALQLPFSPTSLTSNFGLLAFGSQTGDIALSALPSHSHAPTLFEIKGNPLASINNSLCFSLAPLSSSPRLLVSTNDEQIDVYTVVGEIPPHAKSRRRREIRRRPSITPPLEWPKEEEAYDETAHPSERCRLKKIGPSIKLGTPVNHSSVSPDGRYMVSVGDDNLIRLFSAAKSMAEYTLIRTFTGSNDASFSTDWSKNSLSFAVGSQDGVVSIFDARNLAPLDSVSPRRIATLHSPQKGSASAIRKVKFSSTESGSEILAFTEHRSILQVVSATQYDTPQIITVPPSSSTSTPAVESSTTSPQYYQPMRPMGQYGFSLLPSRISAAQNADIEAQMMHVLNADLPPPTFTLRMSDLTDFGSTSAYFPEDHSTPDDLLGMDFDEWGETLFVATNDKVWSYRVDTDAQRRSETFSTL